MQILFLSLFFFIACNQVPDETDIIAPPDKGVGENTICFLNECMDTINFDISIYPEYDYADPFESKSFPPNLNAIQYRPPLRLIDLEVHPTDLELSDYFVIREVMSVKKGPLGLFSPSTLNHLNNMRQKQDNPLVINSAYRNPQYNHKIGGAAWSRHQYGDAVDIWSPYSSLEELQELCQQENASFILLYTNHIHCDWRDEELEQGYFDPISPSKKDSDLLSQQQAGGPLAKIVLSTGKIGLNETVTFKSELYFAEDPQTLQQQWEITYPDKSISSYNSSQKIELILSQSGSYTIKNRIGGTILTKRTFLVR